MAHELHRVMAAFSRRPWMIDPARGAEILAALELRHARGPRREAMFDEPAEPAPARETAGKVAVLNLMGTICPRASAMRDVSAAFTAMDRFMSAFREAADDGGVAAIVLNVDSPGGMVDLVPEAASLVAGARREDRPIYAVANTLAASAAYYVAVSADRVFATPSATVGSIGVRLMHVDHSRQLKAAGMSVTHVHAGARKVEGSPYDPLDKAAKAALQAEVDATYAGFVAHVARMRGVPEAVVRADPESAERHMGGGRAYHAAQALALGMIDEIATFDQVLARAGAAGGAPSGAGRRRGRSRAEMERARLDLL